jgi:hypothetical protein
MEGIVTSLIPFDATFDNVHRPFQGVQVMSVCIWQVLMPTGKSCRTSVFCMRDIYLWHFLFPLPVVGILAQITIQPWLSAPSCRESATPFPEDVGDNSRRWNAGGQESLRSRVSG